MQPPFGSEGPSIGAPDRLVKVDGVRGHANHSLSQGLAWQRIVPRYYFGNLRPGELDDCR